MIQLSNLYITSILTVCWCSCHENTTVNRDIISMFAVVYAPAVVRAISQRAFRSTATDIVHENCTFSTSIEVTDDLAVVPVRQRYITRAPAIAEKPRDSFMSVEMLADVCGQTGLVSLGRQPV